MDLTLECGSILALKILTGTKMREKHPVQAIRRGVRVMKFFAQIILYGRWSMRLPVMFILFL